MGDVTNISGGSSHLSSHTAFESTIFLYTSSANKGLSAVPTPSEDDDNSFTIPYSNGAQLAEEGISVLLNDTHQIDENAENGVTNFELVDAEGDGDTISPSFMSDSSPSETSFTDYSSQNLLIDDSGDTSTFRYYPQRRSTVVKKAVALPVRPVVNHWSPLQCTLCLKVFGSISSLTKHKLTHSDERKYVCMICRKGFKRQDHLNGHMLTHRNKKPFECTSLGCVKSYCDARSLRRHQENHHMGFSVSSPTITVQEVISTASAPSCIQYAPPNAVCEDLPQTRDIGTETKSSVKTPNNKDEDNLTPDQVQLLEEIMQEQRKKMRTEHRLAKQQQSVMKELQEPLKTVFVGNDNSKTTTTNGVGSSSKPSDSQNKCEPSKTYEQPKKCEPPLKYDIPRPVECNLCHRKFKNIPALNGHMRLHGGYYKKENDTKKSDKKESQGPPLTTASVGVRALIEEKIIQKRKTNQMKNKLKQNESERIARIIPIVNNGDSTLLNSNAQKLASFVVPTVPAQTSTSSGAMVRTNSEPSIQQEKLMLNNLLMENSHEKPVRRASSDPGRITQSPQFVDLYRNSNNQYYSGNLGDDMFASVQDAESMLLDSSNELSQLPQIQDSDFDTISLHGYGVDDLHHSELQAVLNSPLPDTFAEFSYMGESTDAQSPLPSPGFTYPTPPASQEGQSPSFYQSNLIHRSVSSPLSNVFYTSGMSSPGAVEAALCEVLPSVDASLYSPASSAVMPVTPEPSPLQSSTYNTSEYYELEEDGRVCRQTLVNNGQSFMYDSSDDYREVMDMMENGYELQQNAASDDREDITLYADDNANGNLIFQTENSDSENVMYCASDADLSYTGDLFLDQGNIGFDNVQQCVDSVYVDTNTNGYFPQVTSEMQISESLVNGSTDADGQTYVDEWTNKEEANVPSMPTQESNNSKRSIREIDTVQYPQKSKLRLHQNCSSMLHYTPPPMLDSSRSGTGLYWKIINNSAHSSNTGAGDEEHRRAVPKNEFFMESDKTPHINIGPHFQALIKPMRPNPQPCKKISYEDLLWKPSSKMGLTENEIDRYLEFACCSAITAGGQNKEYALHILHLCQGDVHKATEKLLQSPLLVENDHSLLTFNYEDNEIWNPEEIQRFQDAIFKYDKNFSKVAEIVGSKSTKQCVQFYYTWKKGLPSAFNKAKANWKMLREMDVLPISNMNVEYEVEVESTELKNFECQYPDCCAKFNSKAALNGHNRIHSTSDGRQRIYIPTPIGSGSSTCSSDMAEEFPCKLCGKIFNKIKSRSAHMKSHRPLEADAKKLIRQDSPVYSDNVGTQQTHM